MQGLRYLLVLCFICLMTAASSEPIYNSTPIHEAFVVKSTEDYAPRSIPNQPPAPINEQIPAKPFPEAIWISGYWAWVVEKNDFTWVCGVWRRPPPNQVWVSGFWNQNPDGWAWACGFWSPVASDQLVLIPNAPPHAVNDNVAASPSKNYFWIPGYWDYSSSSQQYSWLSGKWNPYNKNWILTPATYIWRPNGYAFVPLYWDWPLEKRGNAYSCSLQSAPLVIIQPSTIVDQLFMCYPNYITLYSYWWFYNPGWWDGCWCLPPWWFWDDWWAFAWGDLWDLWWWWADPDDLFPPFWINIDISIEIAPAPEVMVQFMRQLPKPDFPSHPGNQPLRPTGPRGLPHLPRPRIPVTLTPSGTVTPPMIPQMPSREVTPPPPPTTVIQTFQYNPPKYTPPQPQPQYNSPKYIPPQYNPPPRRTPPSTKQPTGPTITPSYPTITITPPTKTQPSPTTAPTQGTSGTNSRTQKN